MSDRPVISIAFGFVCESHTHLHEYGMTHHNNVNNNTIITTKLLPQGQWFHTNKNPFKNELWPGYADLLYLKMCQAPKTVNATLMQDHLLTCLPDKCLLESSVKLHSRFLHFSKPFKSMFCPDLSKICSEDFDRN